jgi:hypothetical protein
MKMKRILILTAFVGVCSTSQPMNFKIPNLEERTRAIGSTENLATELKKALDPQAFDPIHAPKRGDWLAVHRETGQTFDDFVGRKPNRPHKTRNRIYLQPLRDFPKSNAPPLHTLKCYAAA